jgi:hypothetical protein
MMTGLALDGFRLGGYVPHVIGSDDARRASLVVAIDTELPPEARAYAAHAEVWDGFPPMRERYFPSRAALKIRVERLVARLAVRRFDGGVPPAATPRARGRCRSSPARSPRRRRPWA